MKIILRTYNEMRFGNLSTMSLDIPNNRITVKELKNLIYLKYKIIPSEQKLSYKICHKKLITLSDTYPLSFFYVKEDSMIFIENISNNKNKENTNINSCNSKKDVNLTKIKYMNMLGYFLPDGKTVERNNKKKMNSSKTFLRNRKTSSNSGLSPSSYCSNNNINSDNDDTDDCYFLVNDEDNYKYDNKSSDKKSIQSNNINEDIHNKRKISINTNNEKVIRNLLSTDLIEKLSIYIRENNFKKIKSFLSLNKDINDCNSISTLRNKKFSSTSQLNTNYNTSFDSDYTSNSQLVNNNICEILDKNGWNAIHYSSYFGYNEILDFILNKFNNKSNVNIINYEGWNALLLAVYKQNIKCVELLLAHKGIDINYNGLMGTALHIACKKNNIKITSLLLNKADFTIKDKNNKIAIEYTHDKNIIKLLSKIVTKKIVKSDKKSDIYQKLYIFINEYKHLLITKDIPKEILNSNYSLLKGLNNIPIKPPFLVGEVEKIEGFFNSRKKIYIEINPIKGLLRIFKTVKDYPNNPFEIIHLTDITQCIKADEHLNYNNNYFFYINYKNNKGIGNEFVNNNFYKYCINNKIISTKYLVHSSEMCHNLVVVINIIIKFHEYWNSTIKNLKNKKEKIIDYLCQEKFNTLKFNIDTNNYVLLDDKGMEIEIKSTIFQINQINNENNNLNNENTENNLNKKNHKDSKKEEKESNKKINFNSFEILEYLGSGSFGKVFKVRLKSTNEIFAMKVINKSLLIKNKLLRYAKTECNILKKSNCPFIIKLHYSFQTPENLYMILDYCPKGDLKYQIDNNSLLEEEEAKFYIAELIIAIEYLHKNDILYRDLKPENILIDSEGHIKLIDFNLAKENVKNNISNNTFCGSPLYLSPEVLKKQGATKATDIYGIGAILYKLVTGKPPFYSRDPNKMFQNITENRLKFHEFLSDEIRDLFTKLLDKDPNNRLGINNDKKDLKDHIFFQDINWEEISKKKNRPPADMIDYFQENNINNDQSFIDFDYTCENYHLKRVQNFTFIKSE